MPLNCLPVVVGLAIKLIIPKVAQICKWHLAIVTTQTFFVKCTVLNFQHELVIDDFRAVCTEAHFAHLLAARIIQQTRETMRNGRGRGRKIHSIVTDHN